MIGSLTDNINTRSANILYVIWVIYCILTIESAREEKSLLRRKIDAQHSLKKMCVSSGPVQSTSVLFKGDSHGFLLLLRATKENTGSAEQLWVQLGSGGG